MSKTRRNRLGEGKIREIPGWPELSADLGVLVGSVREVAECVTDPEQDAQLLEAQVGARQHERLAAAVARLDEILRDVQARLSIRLTNVKRTCLGSLAVVGSSQARKSCQATKIVGASETRSATSLPSCRLGGRLVWCRGFRGGG